MTRQYYGIEDLGLTAPQRQTLIDRLKLLGRNNAAANPALRNHWRVRPDNAAVIFEADFDDSEWTVDSVKGYLADLFGVPAATITDATAQTAYGPVVTFSRNGDRLRLVAFGGLRASYVESHAQVLAYLRANTGEW